MAKRKQSQFQQSTLLGSNPYRPTRISDCFNGDHSLSNEDLKIKVLPTKPPDELLTNVAKQMASEDFEKMKTSVKGNPARLTIICEDVLKKNISREVLSNMCIDGSENDRDVELLSWICSVIKAVSNKTIRVWIGYQAHEQKYPLFVAIVKERDPHLDEKLRTVLQTELPFKVIQRHLDEVSDEAMRCLKSENPLRYSLKEHFELRETIMRYSGALMQAHSNLLIISASPIKSRKAGEQVEEKTCIVLYVHIKGIIPLQEKAFPAKVGEFPVDVREGVFKKYSLAKLSIGNEILSEYGMIGQLGGFVRFSDGKLGCLTCYHLFDTPRSTEDRKRKAFKPAVYQAASGYSQSPFGRVVAEKYDPGDENRVGVDAALIEITDRLKTPEDTSFRIHSDTALEPGDHIEFSSGEVLSSPQEIIEILQSEHAKCKIVKYNEGTKRMYMRTGILNITGTTVTTWCPTSSDDKCKLFLQLEIRPVFEEIKDSDDKGFAREGESGALVFIASDDLKHKWAIGMVVGGMRANGAGIVTPIWAILDSFGLPRRLLSFEKQRLTQMELCMKDLGDQVNGVHQKLDQILGHLGLQAQ